jgi:hypothetical protein
MEESITALRVIGDIGGTYARFAVAERGKYSELQHLSESKYATLEDALGEYLDALPRDMCPTRGALAVAGPVSGDEVKLTNLNWSFSIAALKADLNMGSLVVVNDFAATAMSVPYLPEVDCYPIGQPQSKTGGPVGVIGPGTGLGVGTLVPDAGRSSIATFDDARGRYEIRGVMGPDEFHDSSPASATAGRNNNAYSNIMAVWVLCRALEVHDLLSEVRRAELTTQLGLSVEEIARWGDISRKMHVPFHDHGIISQFEGYEKLLEIDWEDYRTRYGNIQRIDLILEMENDSANRYKLSKQADVLMLFYLFSAEEVGELFERLGYPFEYETIPRNVAYYAARSCHGSTLCRVVYARVLARSGPAALHGLFRGSAAERRDRYPAGHHRGGHPPGCHGRNCRSNTARVDRYRSKRRCSATQSGIAAGDRAPRHVYPLPRAFTRSAADARLAHGLRA